MTAVDPRIGWAIFYNSLGWWLFIVRGDTKEPFGNCAGCPKDAHDGWACPHILCHGHQASTLDLVRVLAMLAGQPTAHLAVATGTRSRLIILDGESHDLGPDAVAPGCNSGADLLECWGSVYGWDLPYGPAARSISGGLHVPLSLGPDDFVSSRNLMQSALDCQAEGRYAVLPDGTTGRQWLRWPYNPPRADYHLLDHLEYVPRTVFKRSSGGPKRMVNHVPGPIPSDEEFTENGLGIHSGARHSDAYQLGWRYAGRGMSELQAMEALREVWDMSLQTGKTWEKIWGHCQAGMKDQQRKSGVPLEQATRALAELVRWAKGAA